jgi:predicted nucleic acid-binding protein
VSYYPGRGKRAGLLSAVAPVLDAMLALGLRVSQELVDETLNLAGEK